MYNCVLQKLLGGPDIRDNILELSNQNVEQGFLSQYCNKCKQIVMRCFCSPFEVKVSQNFYLGRGYVGEKRIFTFL